MRLISNVPADEHGLLGARHTADQAQPAAAYEAQRLGLLGARNARFRRRFNEMQST
jgi:hypothetical protein